MKKSQIEMFGLLILVMLIAISLVIAVRFMLGSSSQSEIPVEPRLTSQAINLELALTRTSVCENTDFTNVLIACCNDQDSCGKNACDLAKEILDSSLPQLIPNQNYNVSFSIQNKECLTSSKGSCEEFVTSSYPIKNSGSVYNMVVSICKK